ncbi:MAG: thiamine-phosphate kinase [Alphaproteobacteria bacterium]|jgi:thiamine-monophosphate kinase
MKEFAIIKKYIEPLANNKESLGLKDDVAIIPKNSTTDYVVSKDGITEGVHFPNNYPAKYIARRLIRSNLSDLASSGAVPKYYLLFTSLTKNIKEPWIKAFYAELALEQKKWGVKLIGGDSIKNLSNQITLSLTIMGEVPKNKAMLRFQAEVGDDIFVTGTIGNAFVGLKMILGEIKQKTKEGDNYFLRAFNNFTPPVEFAHLIAKKSLSKCAIDVSDGFLADLLHILENSNKGATIYLEKIPLSVKAKKLASIEDLLSGGDDYQIIFTANAKNEKKLLEIAKKTNTKISKIGKIEGKKGSSNPLHIIDNKGKKIEFTKLGYSH